MNLRITWIALATVAALAACGGGGVNDGPANLGDIPASAVASPEAFSSYVGTAREDDAAEPLALDGVQPPASESAEPQALR